MKPTIHLGRGGSGRHQNGSLIGVGNVGGDWGMCATGNGGNDELDGGIDVVAAAF